jgi:hypothetical protein
VSARVAAVLLGSVLALSGAVPAASAQASGTVRATTEGRWNGLRDQVVGAPGAPAHEVEGGVAASGELQGLGGTLGAQVSLQHWSDLDERDTDFRVNELYYQRFFGNVLTAVGRKRVRWGVGYVSSPADVVSSSASPLDPEDRFFEIEGRDAVQVKATFSASSIEVLALREDDDALYVEDHAVVGRAYANVRSVDVAVIGGVEQGGAVVAGGTAAYTIGDALEVHGEVLYDSDIAGRIPVVQPDGLLRMPRDETVQALLGGQWTSGGGVNVIVEYLYFGGGLSGDAFRRLVQAGALAVVSTEVRDASAIRPLQTHYAFGRIAKSNVFTDVDVNWIAFAALEDGSHTQRLQVVWNAHDHLGLYGEIFGVYGSSTSEFGQSPLALGTRLRVRVAF